MRFIALIALVLSLPIFAELPNSLINEDILIGELLAENDFFVQDVLPSEEDMCEDIPIE